MSTATVSWPRPRFHSLSAGLAAGVLAIVAASGEAVAKIPGATHCYFGICHRVKTLPETQALVGSRTILKSSFYDDCKVDRFNPCTLTSSGEIFKPHRPDNAASPIYPDGTTLLVWNPKTRSAAVVRVNSAGPYHSNRTLDVSRATAERLGFKRSGVATLHVQVLSSPTAKETRYKKHREYPAVAGPIGNFSSFELASADLSRWPGARPASTLIAAKPLSPTFKITALPINNAKALNAAGRTATMTGMATIAGTPGQAPAMSVGAILMNAIPHNMLPMGILTDVKKRTAKAQIKAVEVLRPRKVAAPLAPKT